MEINTLNHIPANTGIQKAQAVREAQIPVQEKPIEPDAKPEFYQEPDQYSPKEPPEAAGNYWVEPGKDGPKVNFANPEKKPESKRLNVTTTDTDEVDREIERLKQKVEDLEQQVGKAQGPERERLERKLKQAQSELDQKDNDAYRRAHAKIS